MKISSSNFANGDTIPAEFAFGKRGDEESPIALSSNRNPALAWSDIPDGTRSFALICVDPDVPSSGETVNRKDVDVPMDLPRTDFYHWVMADIPADCRAIAEGAASNGITAHGKQNPPGPAGSRHGINDYTGWFANDADMQGDYHGYDGPCPPFNDPRLHHYHFRLFALDVDSLALPERFTGSDLFRAIEGHVLAEANIHGTYSLYYKA